MTAARTTRTLATGGLSYRQQSRIWDACYRIGGVELGTVAATFAEADVEAARAIDAMARGREWTEPADRYVFGLAVGIRLGRMFIPPMRRSKHWISDEYRQLHEPTRRIVQRYIRTLLKAQVAPRAPRRATDPKVELAAARAWVQKAGKLARQVQP